MNAVLAAIIIYAANIFMALIVIRSFMGWVKQALVFQHYWFFGSVMKIVDPYLTIVKRFIPVSFNQWDFTPVAGVVLVEIVKDLLLLAINMAAK